VNFFFSFREFLRERSRSRLRAIPRSWTSSEERAVVGSSLNRLITCAFEGSAPARSQVQASFHLSRFRALIGTQQPWIYSMGIWAPLLPRELVRAYLSSTHPSIHPSIYPSKLIEGGYSIWVLGPRYLGSGDIKHPLPQLLGGGRFGQGQSPREKSRFLGPDQNFLLACSTLKKIIALAFLKAILSTNHILSALHSQFKIQYIYMVFASIK
jgi:hypothetical protein